MKIKLVEKRNYVPYPGSKLQALLIQLVGVKEISEIIVKGNAEGHYLGESAELAFLTIRPQSDDDLKVRYHRNRQINEKYRDSQRV